MAGRVARGVYVPPSRRNSSGTDQGGPRSLADVDFQQRGYNIKVVLEFPEGFEVDLSSCPLDVDDYDGTERQDAPEKTEVKAQPVSVRGVEAGTVDDINREGAGGALDIVGHGSQDPSRASDSGATDVARLGVQKLVLTIPHAVASQEYADELLDWLMAEAKRLESELGSRESGLSLSLPAHLTKQERAYWHKVAERKGLISESEGLGDERFLKIMSAKQRRSGGLSEQLQRKAKQIWQYCQVEGGSFWNYSQKEVEAMLRPGGQLHADIAALLERREAAQRLCAAIRAGDSDAALSIIEAQPKAAYIQDDFSGGYAIHVAAWHGMEHVVGALLDLPGTRQQTDAQRHRPIDVARSRQAGDGTLTSAVVELLEEAERKSMPAGPRGPPMDEKHSGAGRESAPGPRENSILAPNGHGEEMVGTSVEGNVDNNASTIQDIPSEDVTGGNQRDLEYISWGPGEGPQGRGQGGGRRGRGKGRGRGQGGGQGGRWSRRGGAGFQGGRGPRGPADRGRWGKSHDEGDVHQSAAVSAEPARSGEGSEA